MKFFDRDFMKYAFQFLVLVSLTLFVIFTVSNLQPKSEIRAGVLEGQ